MTKKVYEQVADEKYRMFKRAGYSEDRCRRERQSALETGRKMADHERAMRDEAKKGRKR